MSAESQPQNELLNNLIEYIRSRIKLGSGICFTDDLILVCENNGLKLTNENYKKERVILDTNNQKEAKPERLNISQSNGVATILPDTHSPMKDLIDKDYDDWDIEKNKPCFSSQKGSEMK